MPTKNVRKKASGSEGGMLISPDKLTEVLELSFGSRDAVGGSAKESKTYRGARRWDFRDA